MKKIKVVLKSVFDSLKPFSEFFKLRIKTTNDNKIFPVQAVYMVRGQKIIQYNKPVNSRGTNSPSIAEVSYKRIWTVFYKQ